MARFKDRERSLELRKQGMSYSQIKRIIGVNKSTLSGWLKDYPLSKERIKELRDWNEQRIERCRETKRVKKEARLNGFYKEQKETIFPLDKKELYLAGLFLYWGEGSKNSEAKLSVSNTDPSVIKFFIYWLTKYLKVPRSKLKVYLQLYADMDIENEKSFWSITLNIPLNQFSKPYIKNTPSTRINHKGGFGHGTCNLGIGDARLSEKILMAIKSISDKYANMRL